MPESADEDPNEIDMKEFEIFDLVDPIEMGEGEVLLDDSSRHSLSGEQEDK